MHTKLPQYSRVLFERTPLALVIAQIRFPPAPGYANPSVIDNFARGLRDEYPLAERMEQLSLSLSPRRGVEHDDGPTIWRFSSLTRDWSVVLAENALTVEVRGYSSIGDLMNRFSKVQVILQQTLDPTLVTRIGLRYVNEIRSSQASSIEDWRKLIRSEVLGLSSTIQQLLDDTKGIMSRQDLRVQFPDGDLLVRHGFQLGTTVEPLESDAPPQGPFYLLDMDFSSMRNIPLDSAMINNIFTEYNDVMYRLFRWIILDPLYEELGPTDDK